MFRKLIANVNIERPNEVRKKKEKREREERQRQIPKHQDAYRLHINRFDMNQDCGNPFIIFCFVFCVLCAVCVVCIYIYIQYNVLWNCVYVRILKVTITTYHNMTNNIENTHKQQRNTRASTITAHSLAQLFSRMAKPKSAKIILTTFITN